MRRSQNIQSILLAEAMEQLSNTHFCFHIFQTTHLHSCVLRRSHPSRCSHTQRPHQEKSKPQKEEEVSYTDRHPCEKGTKGSTARRSEKEVPSGQVYVQNLKTNNKTKTERFRGLWRLDLWQRSHWTTGHHYQRRTKSALSVCLLGQQVHGERNGFQCTQCNDWALVECTGIGKSPVYICHNCDSVTDSIYICWWPHEQSEKQFCCFS